MDGKKNQVAPENGFSIGNFSSVHQILQKRKVTHLYKVSGHSLAANCP